MIDSANCPLCCILLFPLQQVCVTHSVLSPRSVVIYCTCCSSCFPYISKKAQQGRAAFPEKAAAKSCSLLFPFQQDCLSSQVVIRCTCCSSCFPYISKKAQQGQAAFPEKAAAKSCSLLFPFQQDCLSSQVVIRCTCCSSCFPYISKKTQYKVLTNRLTRD